MQLNKVLKGLMIALPVMAIAACSSNKNASNDGSEGMLGAGTGMDANGGNGNMSSEEQARLQMQQLQQNNIVYFDLDKYDIRSDFAQMLDAHANFLRSNPSYKCICRVKAFLQTRSPSFLTVKKNLQYWVMTKRHTPKTVVRYWFTKRIA